MERKQVTRSNVLLRHIKWNHLVAGMSGGVLSTLVLHPLDLIKVRFQVDEGYGFTKRPQYRGLIQALRTIAKTSGITGLYQGVTPNVLAAGASWGLYFFYYNAIKTWMQDGEKTVSLGPLHHTAAASGAGIVTLMFTNPLWVAKTRICLQYGTASKVASNVTDTLHYRGTIDCLIKIYRTEGMRGLYMGFLPGVFGVSQFALQFMAYEEMKNRYNKRRQKTFDARLSTLEYIAFAAISKMFAASTTYPYQVVRSRLQDQHRQYKTVRDVITQVWKFEGARGFYKGLVPYLLRVTPACCITFVVYEHLIAFLCTDQKS